MSVDSNSAKPTDLSQVPGDSNPDESIERAAIYARTSENKPEFAYSINEQVDRCWQRCEQQGWEVTFVFTDNGETGKNTDRDGFQQFLKRAAQGAIDVVVFWKLDRFARSLADLVKTEEKLSERGVALHSVTEFLDTSSPVGRFNFRNLASAAELESDLTSQRVQMGMHGMAKKNRWPNDDPPLGYDLAEDQTLLVNPEEAELVRRIFKRYLEQRSMPEVAHTLNQQGITTSRNSEWSHVSIRNVLSNELYRGKYELGEYTEQVEDYRIISDELFEAVTDTRYRFKHEKGEMSASRKQSKAEKVLETFRDGLVGQHD